MVSLGWCQMAIDYDRLITIDYSGFKFQGFECWLAHIHDGICTDMHWSMQRCSASFGSFWILLDPFGSFWILHPRHMLWVLEATHKPSSKFTKSLWLSTALKTWIEWMIVKIIHGFWWFFLIFFFAVRPSARWACQLCQGLKCNSIEPCHGMPMGCLCYLPRPPWAGAYLHGSLASDQGSPEPRRTLGRGPLSNNHISPLWRAIWTYLSDSQEKDLPRCCHRLRRVTLIPFVLQFCQHPCVCISHIQPWQFIASFCQGTLWWVTEPMAEVVHLGPPPRHTVGSQYRSSIPLHLNWGCRGSSCTLPSWCISQRIQSATDHTGPLPSDLWGDPCWNHTGGTFCSKKTFVRLQMFIKFLSKFTKHSQVDPSQESLSRLHAELPLPEAGWIKEDCYR